MVRGCMHAHKPPVSSLAFGAANLYMPGASLGARWQQLHK